MAFNLFPYSNLHNLNLDWILNTVKAMAAAVEAAASTVETYAARLAAVETTVQQISPAAAGAVRHDVSQSLDAANRRRAATNIHAVSYDPQLLSAAEQAQARNNIGAVSSGDIPPAADAVLYTAQQLTEAQQGQARSNIAAASQSDMSAVQTSLQRAVRWDVQQLTDVQKQQARTNIGATAASDIPDVSDVLRYSSQTLTTGQKSRARENIGAADAADLPLLVSIYPDELGTSYECDTRVSEMITQAQYGRVVLVLFTPLNSDIRYQCVAQFDDESSPNTVVAIAYNPNDPASHQPFNWYRIYLAAGSEADTLIVSEQSGWLVPLPQLGDQGKLLAVNNLGRPVWAANTPFIINFSEEGSSIIVDKTLSQIREAFIAGKTLYAKDTDSGIVLPLSFIVEDETEISTITFFGKQNSYDTGIAFYYNDVRNTWECEGL